MRRFEAVAFDLLTALLDSWSLWAAVAGDRARGEAWRTASLAAVTTAGNYAPYEDLVLRATREVGLPEARTAELLQRCGELKPWPEVPTVLNRLAGWRLAIVTNCSQRLAEQAAASTGGRFEQVVSAERAGFYKPDPRPYRLAAELLGLPPERVLFVAGFAHDLPGAAGAGMPVYWSNRARLPIPAGATPLLDAPDLLALPALLGSVAG